MKNGFTKLECPAEAGEREKKPSLLLLSAYPFFLPRRIGVLFMQYNEDSVLFA